MNVINKFSGTTPGSLLADLNYFKKLRSAQKLLEKEVLSELRVNSEVLSNRKFSSHPQKIYSDTDTSLSISPKQFKVYSDVTVGISLSSEEDQKIFVKHDRKKKHTFLTQTKQCYSSPVELEIGDSPLVTIRNKSQSKVKHAEDMLPNRRATSSKPNLESTQKNVLSDVAFEKKFKLTIEKVIHAMTDINSLLEKGIDQPDGDEDISRRKLRVKEFSNRFSRNYLYPIARQLDDLNRIKSPSTRNPNQKLLSAYTVILNGLQAYHHHLPTSIGDCSADKLQSLLKQLLELGEVHARMLKESETDIYLSFIEIFKSNAELTISKSNDYMKAISTESMLKPVATRISLAQKRKKTKPKTNIAERLSMYAMPSSFRKDPIWRKTAESLTYKKQVKSRYKTATFSHRPPVEKLPLLALPSKCSYFPSKSSMKKSPMTTPIREDEIPTMVQMENERSNKNTDENRNEVNVTHEDLLVKLLQLVLDNNQLKENSHGNPTDNAADNEVKISDVLEKLKKHVDPEALRKIVEELKKKGENDGQQLELKISDSCATTSTDATVKKRKEPRITVTGPKNAKLICIKDDNSPIDSEEENAKDEDVRKHDRTGKDAPLKTVSSSHTQTLENHSMKNKSTQRPPTQISMKKLKKSSKCLQMLPKHYAVNIIQYKLDFHKYCREIPMYRRTTNILPWILMGKISDEILNFALLGVARGIEVNDIAEKIYQSELQL